MKTLYHGTSSHNLESIKMLGLVPGLAKGGDKWAVERHMPIGTLAKFREPSVFVTDSKANAEYFSYLAVKEVKGDPIVITLHIPEAVFQEYAVDELYEKDKHAKPHAWRTSRVSAQYVGEAAKVHSENAQDILSIMDELLGALHA